VTIYKTLVLVQKRANGGKERSLDTFLAGVIGGYVVFGERTAINEQVPTWVLLHIIVSPAHYVCVDCFVCLLSCGGLPDSSLNPCACHDQPGVRQTHSTRGKSVLALRGTLMGCRHVAVPFPWGDSAAGDVLLDELSLPRLRQMEGSPYFAVAQYVSAQ
jgi:hypothetical protein